MGRKGAPEGMLHHNGRLTSFRRKTATPASTRAGIHPGGAGAYAHAIARLLPNFDLFTLSRGGAWRWGGQRRGGRTGPCGDRNRRFRAAKDSSWARNVSVTVLDLHRPRATARHIPDFGRGARKTSNSLKGLLTPSCCTPTSGYLRQNLPCC